MDIMEILTHVDHTALSQCTTEHDIDILCNDAIKYNAASVCVPPHYVEYAKKISNDKIKICTVIGFPNGYHTTSAKVFETEDAVKNGADEIDMVINICLLKDKKHDELLSEIKAVKAACQGKLLKVIIETSLLTDDEKVVMCDIVSRAGADYIKTSTGFSSAGATLSDIDLFRKHIYNGVKIKASGGIKTFEQAEEFIAHGSDRLGTSSLIKSLKNN